MKTYILRFRQVDQKSFDALVDGSKPIETRAATTKYQNIKPGDVLVITCGKKRVEKTVKQVQHFPSIESLFDVIPLKQVNPWAETLTDAKEMYYSYPGYKEKIEQFGFLAFELE